MRPEGVFGRHQDHPVAGFYQIARQIEAEHIAAQHHHLALSGQEIAHFARGRVEVETVQQRSELIQFRRQMGGTAAGDQQLAVADLLLVCQGQCLAVRIDVRDETVTPHIDTVVQVILDRIDQKIAPVTAFVKQPGKFITAVEKQPAGSNDGDPALRVALAQYVGRLVAGHTVAYDHIVLS